MSSKSEKPGFFQRLFGRSKSSSGGDGTTSDGGAAGQHHKTTSSSLSAADSSKAKRHPSPLLVAPPVKTRTSSSGSSSRSPTSPPTSAGSVTSSQSADRKSARRQTSGGKRSGKGGKHRKRTKTLIDPTAIKVDVTKPIEFPTTPEMILAYHKTAPFLSRNEEWLLVELNEFECLVDSIDIIKSIAEHSQFFEVEPDQLWEEFFEFVDEVPSYDEIINFDVWQEFRDVKYQC